MFDIQNYGSFVMAVALFQAIPGPGTLTILNATARGGVRGGMSAVFGTLTGDFIYMLAAVLGVSAVLSAYPELLAGAQWVGVAYLCWMGLKLLLVPASEAGSVPEVKAFRQALAVSLTNPKVIMFFMAFFPLFLPAEPRPATLAALMGHVTAISLLYQTTLVLAGNAVARRLACWRGARLLATRLAGVALVAFGAKLALSARR